MNLHLSNGASPDDRTNDRQSVRFSVERGFSILELMIALYVLLFGFIAIANLIATSIVVNRSSNRLTSLTQLASEKLEELRSYDVNDPLAHAGGSLGNDVTALVVDATGNHTVSYFDAVYLNQRNGSITRTGGPDDTGGYPTETTTIDGTTTTGNLGGEPTQVSYRRRWLIESNTPINGATQITVEVAVKTNKLSDPDSPGTVNNFRQVIRMRAIR
ncbi:MAG: hypothetical protein ACHQKY_12335 [Terriglobia bacterium]